MRVKLISPNYIQPIDDPNERNFVCDGKTKEVDVPQIPNAKPIYAWYTLRDNVLDVKIFHVLDVELSTDRKKILIGAGIDHPEQGNKGVVHITIHILYQKAASFTN